ncbi:hypothetical protein C5167_045363 [Papaver somniferum]|uniref:WRKY domain-containing protein n=1 Tax=Papaver somniferum TaxID=3469 RepID=A0A4Y7LED0_PAPSO|nr:probable WRKY transcription factor 70 [Papaver somniferum]RZC82579.1 hypothetical protein C5167_045363 [Papaver somniferum]
MEDLVRGQEFAKQVYLQLQGSEIPVRNEVLDSVAKILECFANAISKFSSSESSSEVCHSPALTAVDSPFSDCRKLEGTGEIRTIATPKKSGSNKRRKTSDAREELTATPFDDGRAWRKYGQKEILNTKFPKSYFRCTHKTDQGCQATKQVQRIEEEPAKYRVLYIGQHTCNNQLKGPQLFLDANPRHTCLLNFESNYYAPKVEFPFPASISSAKHEFEGDTEYADIASHKNRDSVKSSEFAVWNDLSAFNPSPTTSMMPSTSGSELVDGIAGLYSSADSNPNFVMDMMFEDDDVLQFDPNEFFNSS